jgi:hypothetical protein
MHKEEKWVCQCRRCRGVHGRAGAVRYGWEWAFGSCGVPVVVGVHVGRDAHAFRAFTYWHDVPDDVPLAVGGLQFHGVVSSR